MLEAKAATGFLAAAQTLLEVYPPALHLEQVKGAVATGMSMWYWYQ